MFPRRFVHDRLKRSAPFPVLVMRHEDAVCALFRSTTRWTAMKLHYGVVLGRAASVWDELAEAKRMLYGTPLTIIAVKRAGRDYDGPVHHWVMFHHDLFPAWIEIRAKHHRPPAENYWSCRGRGTKPPRHDVPLKWLQNIGGASGLLGCQVALQPELNLDKIILCGIPMNASKRYDVGTDWKEALAYRAAWRQFYQSDPDMKDKVRSFSGWTQELLGPVTQEWLHEPPSIQTDSSRTASA